MELKLNIYKGRTIEKTYKSSTYEIMFGTVEDVLYSVEIDKINEVQNDAAFAAAITAAVMKAIKPIKEMLKDVFEGLTDEELRRTRVKDIIKLTVQIVTFAMLEFKGVQTEKNG